MSPHKMDGGSEGRAWIMGAEAFERRMPHHDGIKALWETKWRFPCTKSVYPFHDGQYQDFEPIFAHLIDVGSPAAARNSLPQGTVPADHMAI